MALLLALQPVRSAAQIVDRVLQLVADVVVGCDACRERDGAAAADQLVVELLRRGECAHHVLAQLLVRHRPIDIRFDVPCCVVDLVSRLAHVRWILSRRYRAPDTPGPSSQTGGAAGCTAHPRSLRGVRRAEGAAAGRDRPGLPLRGACGLAGRARPTAGIGIRRARARQGRDVPADQAVFTGALRPGRSRARGADAAGRGRDGRQGLGRDDRRRGRHPVALLSRHDPRPRRSVHLRAPWPARVSVALPAQLVARRRRLRAADR